MIKGITKTAWVEEAISSKGRINIQELVDEFYSDIEPDMAYNKAMSSLSSVRRKMIARNIPVVALGDGWYGIPKTKEEVNQALYRLRGAIGYGMAVYNLTHDYADGRNILPDSFKDARFKVPRFLIEDGK